MSRHRVSPNNPVRRRLIFDENVNQTWVNTSDRYRVPSNHQVRQRPTAFDEVVADQARVDNFANKLQEFIITETESMSEKYNFDFINEEALEGPFMWFKKDNDKWIAMKPKKNDIDSKKDDEFSSIQADNENTPVHVKNITVPVIRARKNNIERGGRESVKRRMDFDVFGDSRRRRH